MELFAILRRNSWRSAAVAAAAVVSPALAGAAPLTAATTHGPDLVVASLSPGPTAHIAPGAGFSERFAEKNIGSRRAGASTTGFYLSTAATFGRGATRLTPTVPLSALDPGQNATGSPKLVIPVTIAPGTYYMLACADVNHRVTELSESNNCRTASGRVRVACRATDNPALTSPNKYCFDGDAADGIFVSPAGNDSSPGTMAAPKHTLAAGVAAAAAVDRDVYVAKGTYPEILDVANGVSVFGGYDANWRRSPANTTTITGGTPSGDAEAALAVNITKRTELQLLRLAPYAPSVPGGSSYGLRGTNSGGLLLDHDAVVANIGAGGAPGANGTPGADGQDGQVGQVVYGGAGGTSTIGRDGGAGGAGGSAQTGGDDGSPGRLSPNPDAQGRMGGPGGSGGAANSEDRGGNAYPGDSGSFMGDGSGGASGTVCGGFWCSAYGQRGASGTAGHGGGGGGGGGTADMGARIGDGGGGGGGGAGGAGGGGGQGGQGAGGSFGIFLVGSPGAMVRASTVSALNGGAGGAGGGGALGGQGGGGAFGGVYSGPGGDGGTGGNGGEGGRGGDGGGGAGGPSVGIFGLTAADAPGTTVQVGAGGAGGAGGQGSGDGGGAGAPGAAAAFLGGA